MNSRPTTRIFSVISATTLAGFAATVAGACGGATTVLQAANDGGTSSSSGASETVSSDGGTSGSSGSNGTSSSSSSGASGSSGTSGSSSSSSGASGSSGTSGSSGSSGISLPPGSCLDPTPIDATVFPYRKARVSAGACTTQELDSLSSFVQAKVDANEEVTIGAWSAVVSVKCAECVFGNGLNATWPPIIANNDAVETLNVGGCIEIKSGKESCGRAYQQLTECRSKVCISLCQSSDDFADCLADEDAIMTGPCKVSHQKVQIECGANLGAYETGCKGTQWPFEGPIKVQCISGN
jgi:hypothetical protein